MRDTNFTEIINLAATHPSHLDCRQLLTLIVALQLRLAVAYRIQEKAFGGLKPSSKRHMKAHLEAMARNRSGNADVRPKTPIRLAPGTQLMREWNGATLLVDVVQDGFRWKDTTYRTLSAVAVAITGTKWSGPKFFGLVQGGAFRRRSGTVGQ